MDIYDKYVDAGKQRGLEGAKLYDWVDKRVKEEHDREEKEKERIFEREKWDKEMKEQEKNRELQLLKEEREERENKKIESWSC